MKQPDAGSALISAFLLSLAVACCNSFSACLFAIFIGICFLAFRRPAGSLKRIAAANIFIAFLWLIVPWSTPGAIAFKWGFLTISRPGLELGALVTLKANAIIFIFMALIAPYSLSSLGCALSKLKMPDKLVWIFLLMGRNIHMLAEEWKTLGQAARLRGFKPGANMRTYKTLAAFLAILLLRAHEKAQRIREAMLLRGFSGKLPCLSSGGAVAPGLWLIILILFLVMVIICLETGLLNPQLLAA